MYCEYYWEATIALVQDSQCAVGVGSDAASKLKYRVIKAVEEALHHDRWFAVAYSPWSDVTCDKMMRTRRKTRRM